MDVDEILLDGEDRMDKAVDFLRSEFRMIRTGRASTALVENIKVDYYGAPTPLKQLANLSAPFYLFRPEMGPRCSIDFSRRLEVICCFVPLGKWVDVRRGRRAGGSLLVPRSLTPATPPRP